MLSSDDPRIYRHHSNGHPGQSNSPLDMIANTWLKCRIRLVRRGIRTLVIPEVYVETGEKRADPATGVPKAVQAGTWVQLHDRRRHRPMQSSVVTGMPGGKFRLNRAIRVWSALFHARALVPAVMEDGAAAPT